MEDTILREYLVATATQYNCQGGVNGDDPTEPALSDFATLNSQLDTNNAFKFVSGKLGELRFGSAPVRSAYFMLSHTLLERSLDLLQGFQNVWNYPNNNEALYSEYGAVLNFRILTSSNASLVLGVSQNGRAVYNNIVSGREGYAHVEQDGLHPIAVYKSALIEVEAYGESYGDTAQALKAA